MQPWALGAGVHHADGSRWRRRTKRGPVAGVRGIGRGTLQLESLIARSDLVIVVTDVNSHGAVRHARATAKRMGRPVIITRRCDGARFRDLLTNTLSQGQVSGEQHAA